MQGSLHMYNSSSGSITMEMEVSKNLVQTILLQNVSYRCKYICITTYFGEYKYHVTLRIDVYINIVRQFCVAIATQ